MISVIVPIYNVEEYLSKCLDSLLKQSYTDVEYILVDDGSTDKSGEIAERYLKDSRVRVYHIENQGLSAARNYGLDHSYGEWIMFVDSDDWVDFKFCEKPYYVALNQKADIVIFRAYFVKRNRTGRLHNDMPEGISSYDDAIQFGDNVVWNKLYRRSLFNNIRFPEKMVYEDAATTYKLIYSASKIVFISDYLYYHYNRKGSISNTRSIKNKRDCFIAIYERYFYLLAKHFNKEILKTELLAGAIALIASDCSKDDPYYIKAWEIVKDTIDLPQGLSYKKKIAFIICKKDINLFNIICKLTGRMKW